MSDKYIPLLLRRYVLSLLQSAVNQVVVEVKEHSVKVRMPRTALLDGGLDSIGLGKMSQYVWYEISIGTGWKHYVKREDESIVYRLVLPTF